MLVNFRFGKWRIERLPPLVAKPVKRKHFFGMPYKITHISNNRSILGWRQAKRSLMSRVVVIPKEGWARVAVPILLDDTDFLDLFFKSVSYRYGMTTMQDIRDLFAWRRILTFIIAFDVILKSVALSLTPFIFTAASDGVSNCSMSLSDL